MQNEINNRLDRRELLAAAAGSVAGLAAAPTAARAAAAEPRSREPRNVGSRKQLFIDQRFIAASEHVTLTMNPAQKLGVVLDSEKEPWEHGTGGYFRVIEDGGKFKMYYGAFTDAGHSVCYAESEDALHWTKPNLGVMEVNGSKQNNILVRDNAIDATIMVDPRDVPERRYKLFRSRVANDAGAGVYASYSADGIHFTDAGRVLPMWPETSLIADWDPRIGKYVVFLRVFERDIENQRRIARIETDDLLKPWPYKPTEPLRSPPSPANIPAVLAADEQDDPFTDFYTGAAHIYAHAEDVYLMFPTPFRHFAPSRQPWFRYEPGNEYGLIDVQMAVSRDGIRWERPDRRPYVPMGLPDEWDRWLTMMGVGMVRRGSYLYQYYWSPGRTHDSGILRPEYDQSISTKSGIGAVRQRLDGFISADFAYTGGTLTTPPLLFTGSQLRLNVDTGAMGTAFVEIRDLQGKPIPGFTRADCEEIGGNFVDTLVRWKGKSDLSALRGQPVTLHFTARGAKLYAFEFAAGPPQG
ncbi:MAG: hypothetical protein K0Q72_795 [Armatimonadetes bacterium]|nr:hypothetical protein [Armatimonadota bacterium]